MMLDPLLLEVLVDPIDRGPLHYFEAQDLLFNPRSATVYVVSGGIAVLIPSEGRVVEGAELAELQAGLDGTPQTGALS